MTDERPADRPAAEAAARPGPPPLSPCIKVCVVDRDRGLCLGCMRTLAEISGWWAMPDADKRAVLADLPRRRSAP